MHGWLGKQSLGGLAHQSEGHDRTGEAAVATMPDSVKAGPTETRAANVSRPEEQAVQTPQSVVGDRGQYRKVTKRLQVRRQPRKPVVQVGHIRLMPPYGRPDSTFKVRVSTDKTECLGPHAAFGIQTTVDRQHPHFMPAVAKVGDVGVEGHVLTACASIAGVNRKHPHG